MQHSADVLLFVAGHDTGKHNGVGYEQRKRESRQMLQSTGKSLGRLRRGRQAFCPRIYSGFGSLARWTQVRSKSFHTGALCPSCAMHMDTDILDCGSFHISATVRAVTVIWNLVFLDSCCFHVCSLRRRCYSGCRPSTSWTPVSCIFAFLFKFVV